MPFPGLFGCAVGKGDHAVSAGLVVLEMKLTDPTRPDQGDTRVVFSRFGREVVDRGRFDDLSFLLRAEPVLLLLTHAG